MGTIEAVLDSVVAKLTDENYAESIAFYRLWFDIGQTYLQITSDQTFNYIFNRRGTDAINPESGKLIHPTTHLVLRFAGDVDLQSDGVPPPLAPGLQSRLCTATLREFFSGNLRVVWGGGGHVGNFYADANLIAHWINLGYVEQTAIRNHILQSLISHPKLYDHQADALIILFKIAGATFEAYADPSVIDRCFELLGDHKYHNQDLIDFNNSYPNYPNSDPNDYWTKVLIRGNGYDGMKKELVQVRAPRPVKAVIGLRQVSRK